MRLGAAGRGYQSRGRDPQETHKAHKRPTRDPQRHLQLSCDSSNSTGAPFKQALSELNSLRHVKVLGLGFWDIAFWGLVEVRDSRTGYSLTLRVVAVDPN